MTAAASCVYDHNDCGTAGGDAEDLRFESQQFVKVIVCLCLYIVFVKILKPLWHFFMLLANVH